MRYVPHHFIEEIGRGIQFQWPVLPVPVWIPWADREGPPEWPYRRYASNWHGTSRTPRTPCKHCTTRSRPSWTKLRRLGPSQPRDREGLEQSGPYTGLAPWPLTSWHRGQHPLFRGLPLPLRWVHDQDPFYPGPDDDYGLQLLSSSPIDHEARARFFSAAQWENPATSTTRSTWPLSDPVSSDWQTGTSCVLPFHWFLLLVDPLETPPF